MVTGLTMRAIISLAPACRLQWQQQQQVYALLYPAGMITLNSSAGEILKLCDGSRTMGDIVADIHQRRPGVDFEEVICLIEDAWHKGWIRLESRDSQ